MHIPDVLIDPKVSVATSAVAAVGLGYALRRVEERHGPRATSLMGMTAAFVFAAQMVNFPVGPGVSGHLLGGVLSAVILGPWAGAVVIATVLIVQCLLFQDGGVTALGANFLNMGLIGAVGGYAIYAAVRRALGGRKGILIGAMVAAWFSVLLAAVAFSIELATGVGRSDFSQVLTWMVLVHAVIGVAEALITGLIVRFILLSRPELIEVEPVQTESIVPRPAQTTGWLAPTLAGLGLALAVAIFVSPFASGEPDGMEFVGEKLGFLTDADEETPPVFEAPMAEYEAPLPAGLPASLNESKVATAAAGLIGTLVVFGFAWSMARVFTSKDDRPEGTLVDAA